MSGTASERWSHKSPVKTLNQTIQWINRRNWLLKTKDGAVDCPCTTWSSQSCRWMENGEVDRQMWNENCGLRIWSSCYSWYSWWIRVGDWHEPIDDQLQEESERLWHTSSTFTPFQSENSIEFDDNSFPTLILIMIRKKKSWKKCIDNYAWSHNWKFIIPSWFPWEHAQTERETDTEVC